LVDLGISWKIILKRSLNFWLQALRGCSTQLKEQKVPASIFQEPVPTEVRAVLPWVLQPPRHFNKMFSSSWHLGTHSVENSWFRSKIWQTLCTFYCNTLPVIDAEYPRAFIIVSS
jgi:hypothetical protein